MKKYLFFDDYSEGAHPLIFEALTKSNFQQESGYGNDSFSNKAKDVLRDIIKNTSADIHFVSGGTQANLIIISSILKPYESVICANTGHINIHEAGAVEATGHKINSIKSDDGKITPEMIKQVLDFHQDEHMVKPKLVFISNATELGTIYNKSELETLSTFCKSNNLYLYLDGARIGTAVMSKQSDLTLVDITKLVDIYYIGGTKNGALFGEAIVIINDKLKENFRYHLKQRGALLAKGRSIGIQFQELFKNDLYFTLAEHANKMAYNLTEGISKLGLKFLTASNTNQIFPILPNKIISQLEELYGFYIWNKIDQDNSAIRLVTSWATKKEIVDEFIKDLTRIQKQTSVL